MRQRRGRQGNGNGPTSTSSRVFVIEAGGRPLVAFEAVSLREATELRSEQWFLDELISLRSNKEPIWDGETTMIVRNAKPAEIVEYKDAATSAPNKQGDEILLVYLVPLDGLG